MLNYRDNMDHILNLVSHGLYGEVTRDINWKVLNEQLDVYVENRKNEKTSTNEETRAQQLFLNRLNSTSLSLMAENIDSALKWMTIDSDFFVTLTSVTFNSECAEYFDLFFNTLNSIVNFISAKYESSHAAGVEHARNLGWTVQRVMLCVQYANKSIDEGIARILAFDSFEKCLQLSKEIVRKNTKTLLVLKTQIENVNIVLDCADARVDLHTLKKLLSIVIKEVSIRKHSSEDQNRSSTQGVPILPIKLTVTTNNTFYLYGRSEKPLSAFQECYEITQNSSTEKHLANSEVWGSLTKTDIHRA